jgi:16S rRNA G966 N2-methylase RsmD
MTKEEEKQKNPNTTVKFGFSERKHLPVVKVGRVSYPLWKFRYAKKIKNIIDALCLDEWAKAIIYSELDQFEKYYLPPFSLKDKTVLDLGACCGETAYFYLQHGAKKVICVESDPTRAKLILKNKQNLNLNIELINDFFTPKHLQLNHDFIKCDIEGNEIELIPHAKNLKPCIVEAHGQNVRKQFEKNGFHVVFYQKNDLFLMTNYS